MVAREEKELRNVVQIRGQRFSRSRCSENAKTKTTSNDSLIGEAHVTYVLDPRGAGMPHCRFGAVRGVPAA